ncbi:MAG: hypothetical protein KatS3mg131_3637 [Candidatus Tectimicrobiota bacterium]|nr:MAG: hypothetical protein KatS3mg131_3637 [Candidatus Tectomicrobia bacterium]
MRPLCLGLALLVLSGQAWPQASPPPAAYTLGVFPYLPPVQLERLFAPLAAALGEAVGRQVRFRTAASFEAFGAALQEQRYDLAFVQPFDYVRIAAAAGYLPLARRRQPLVPLVVVLPASPLRNLLELRGHPVALPPPQAAVSLVFRHALWRVGLVPGRDVTLVYYRSHSSCLHQLLLGGASACVTASPPLRLFEAKRRLQLRVLAALPALPSPLFVAHRRLPAAERERLRAAILSWHRTPEGRALLQQAGFEAFVAATDADYEVVRRLWEELGTYEAPHTPALPHCRDDCFAGGRGNGPGVVADAGAARACCH